MVKWSLRYKQVLFHALNKYWLDTDFYSTISGAVGHRGGLVRQALVMYRNRWTGKTQNKGGRRKKQDVDDLAWAQHGADSPQWSSDPLAGVPTSRLQPGTCCQISSGIRWEIKGGGVMVSGWFKHITFIVPSPPPPVMEKLSSMKLVLVPKKCWRPLYSTDPFHLVPTSWTEGGNPPGHCRFLSGKASALWLKVLSNRHFLTFRWFLWLV